MLDLLLPTLAPRRRKAVPTAHAAVVLRWAAPDDAATLTRLGALDSAPPPRGRVLLAEVGGEAWAAMSADDGHAVSDPFRPSAELVLLLGDELRRRRRAARRERRALSAPAVWPAAA